MSTDWISAKRTFHVLSTLLLLVAAPSTAPAQSLDLDGTFSGMREAIYGSIASQIGALPNPSGGSFKFNFDPQLGIFERRTNSLGPVFVHRAETSGKGTFTGNVTFSHYSFDKIDGVDLEGGIRGVLAADNPGAPVGQEFLFDFIRVREQVKVSAINFSGVYGLTEWLDVGISVPILRVSMEERVTEEHFIFCAADLSSCTEFFPSFIDFMPNEAEVSGIGDLVLRGKISLLRPAENKADGFFASLALDVKLPTGSEGDFEQFVAPQEGVDILVSDVSTQQFQLGDPPLGTGQIRVRPILVLSAAMGSFSPHVNVGGEFGSSDFITNDLLFELGFDATLQERLTISADLLGRHSQDIKRDRIVEDTIFDAEWGSEVDATALALAAGAKVNFSSTQLIFANVLLALNDTGIRDTVTPTIGFEMSF